MSEEDRELTNEERSKLLFERGKKSLENQNYLEALHYFKLSNKFQKNFQTDELIKQCEEKIKEMREKEKKEEESNKQEGPNPEDEACEKIIKNNNYYEILGITKETPNDDIKRAYKKLALKFHPDKNKSSKAEEAFKKIATAYQTLTDPKKRELFDKYGSEENIGKKYIKKDNNNLNMKISMPMIFSICSLVILILKYYEDNEEDLDEHKLNKMPKLIQELLNFFLFYN